MQEKNHPTNHFLDNFNISILRQGVHKTVSAELGTY